MEETWKRAQQGTFRDCRQPCVRPCEDQGELKDCESFSHRPRVCYGTEVQIGRGNDLLVGAEKGQTPFASLASKHGRHTAKPRSEHRFKAFLLIRSDLLSALENKERGQELAHFSNDLERLSTGIETVPRCDHAFGLYCR